MRNLCLLLVVVLSSSLAPAASADLPSFRISQVYSNLDGSVQFVEFTEYAGRDGQHRLAGLTLRVAHDGVAKTWSFPADLASERTAFASFVVAVALDGAVPVIANGSGAYPHVPAFGSLPARFVPTERGEIVFADTERVAYDRLPADGYSGIDGAGRVVRATLPVRHSCNGAGNCFTTRAGVSGDGPWVRAVEYYHAALDHYFLTASAADIEALDSGRAGGWARTGEQFAVGSNRWSFNGIEGAKACRYRLPPAVGDSHFISVSADECAGVPARIPGATLETDAAFHAAAADPATGACPAYDDDGFTVGLRPVYRLWNGRLDSNHRYTTRPEIRAAMEARGYVAEGLGPEAVAFCVP